MFAGLLLVAIFSSALPFQAEAKNPPKCNQTLIAQIYAYWHEHNGIPQRVAEHSIKCYEREVAILSTPSFFDEDVTSAVIRHHANSNTVYMMKSDNTTEIHRSEFVVFTGQIIHRLSKNIHIIIAECNGVRLAHKCSRDVNAVEGPPQFLIKGIEGEWKEEDRDAMQKLMCETFGVTETMRTFTEPCVLPEGMEEPIDTCSHGSY